MEVPAPDYGELRGSLEQACIQRGLQATDAFLLRCIQLYETIKVRHGLMVVGSTFAGKTSAIRVLSDALRYNTLRSIHQHWLS